MDSGEEKRTVGVVLCDCGGTLFSEYAAESIRSRLIFSEGSSVEVLGTDSLCASQEQNAFTKLINRKNISRLVVAGCSLSKQNELFEAISATTGIKRVHIRLANVREQVFLPSDGDGIEGEENRIALATGRIRRSIAAVRLIDEIETKRSSVIRRVLIIGDGACAATAAAEIAGSNLEVIIVTESSDAAEELQSLTERGVEIRSRKRLARLDGFIGSFDASLAPANGQSQVNEQVKCGAIIIASGENEATGNTMIRDVYGSDRIVSLHQLTETIAELPRRREVRHFGIVLDRDVDETKASTEQACIAALAIQKEGAHQVHLFCRDARVASLRLEETYDNARDAGVNIIKYSGTIEITPFEDMVEIECVDEVLGAHVTVVCDRVGVSTRGFRTNDLQDLADITGVHLDGLGQLQDNAIHQFSVSTNIPGIFIAGIARGQYYLPQAIEEASVAALETRKILAEDTVDIELSGARVDPEKCAICLTCIRACPHNAMRINSDEGVAENIPEACQRCGICAGECPAKAIVLPEYADDVMISQFA